MTRMFLLTLTSSLLICLMIYSLEACSCADDHPQNRFCEHRHVFVGKVKSETSVTAPSPVSKVYHFEVVNQIKGVPIVGTTVAFRTGANGALCGVSYDIGSVQYVMASEFKVINSCTNGKFEKTDATWSYVHGRRNNNSYRRNCGCKVLEHDAALKPLSCRLPSDATKIKCYYRHALCVRKGPLCVWKNDDACK